MILRRLFDRPFDRPLVLWPRDKGLRRTLRTMLRTRPFDKLRTGPFEKARERARSRA
jgi:hypothetical protein